MLICLMDYWRLGILYMNLSVPRTRSTNPRISVLHHLIPAAVKHFISGSSKLATRCRESGLVPISRLVRRIAAFGLVPISRLVRRITAFGWSSLIGSLWSGAWRKCSMLSSMATEAEPASDGYEVKRMLLAVLSHLVDNRRVVPVSLLTASSTML